MSRTTPNQADHACSGKVYEGNLRCLNRAKVERDGTWYCTRHDPVYAKAKRDAALSSSAEQAELERRAACYDEMLAALQLVAQTWTAYMASPHKYPTYNKACTAISRATGVGTNG